MIGNWQEFLSLSEKDELALLKRHERTGWPLGNERFIDRLEGELSRPLRPQKPGPKSDAK
jgi:putative transposase